MWMILVWSMRMEGKEKSTATQRPTTNRQQLENAALRTCLFVLLIITSRYFFSGNGCQNKKERLLSSFNNG
jgi:hypothetical protein